MSTLNMLGCLLSENVYAIQEIIIQLSFPSRILPTVLYMSPGDNRLAGYSESAKCVL